MSKRKTGAMSWFTFGKGKPDSPRSFSDRLRLPRGQSSSSAARSTISAPFLTSTTNTKVARSEGVHCGELTQETFDKSTWHGKLGWMRTENDHRTAAAQARSLAEQIEADEKFQLKPSARLQKMAEAALDHFRNDKTTERNRTAFKAVPYSSVDSLAEPSSEQKLARYKAETNNLCRDKVRTFTGNGEAVQRSSSGGLLSTTPKPGAEQRDPPLFHHLLGDHKSAISNAALFETSDSNSHHFHTREESSQVGSLTRSFNTALDRDLDTSTSNMDFIRNQAAKMGIRSTREKERDKFKTTISSPLPIDSQLTTDHMDQNNPVVPKWQAIPPPSQTIDADKMLAAMPNPTTVTATTNEQDAPEWARLPVPEGYVSNPNSPTRAEVAAPVVRRAGVAGQTDQDDDINPVGMHGNVEAFTKPPANVRLPDPKLSYPEQLQLTGEYPQQKRESRLDMMQFLAETEAAERKKEEKKAEANEEEKEKKTKNSLRKNISRIFKK